MLKSEKRNYLEKNINLVFDDNTPYGEMKPMLTSIIIEDSMKMGSISYFHLTVDIVNKFKIECENNFYEEFKDLFKIIDDEASLILNKLYTEGEFIYLNRIDLGLNMGMGVGEIALIKFIEKFKSNKIVLYSYPIPIRLELGFDENYMKEIISKLNSFYERVGFKQINQTRLFEI